MIETNIRVAEEYVEVNPRTVDQLDLPQGKFDVVRCSWVLRRVSEAEKPLRRMACALRPGGHLVLQLSLYDHPADAVADLLTEAGLELTHYEPELPPPFSREKGAPLRVRQLAEMRRRFRQTWFASQAEVPGDRFDEFLDEAWWALVEAGETDPHHARIVARRPV